MENYKIEYKLFNEKYNELFNKYFMTGGADTQIDTDIQIKIQKINELQEKYNEKLEIYNEQLTNFLTFTKLYNLNLHIEIPSNLEFSYNAGEEKESINNRINNNNEELFKNISNLEINFKVLDKYYKILNDKFENYNKDTNEFRRIITNFDSYIQEGGLFAVSQPEPQNIIDNNVLSNQVNPKTIENSDDNQEKNIEDYQKIILNLSDDKSIKAKKDNIENIIKQIRSIFFDLKFDEDKGEN